MSYNEKKQKEILNDLKSHSLVLFWDYVYQSGIPEELYVYGQDKDCFYFKENSLPVLPKQFCSLVALKESAQSTVLALTKV